MVARCGSEAEKKKMSNTVILGCAVLNVAFTFACAALQLIGF